MVNVSNNQSFGLQQPWDEFLTFLAMIVNYVWRFQKRGLFWTESNNYEIRHW